MYRHLSALTRLALVVTALAFAAGTGPRIS